MSQKQTATNNQTITMADEDNFGLQAYLDIQQELEQWGEATPVKTPRANKSPGGSSSSRRYYGGDDSNIITSPIATPASARGSRPYGMEEDYDNVHTPASLRSPDAGSIMGAGGITVGVQTPEPPQGHDTSHAQNEMIDGEDFNETTEQLIGDGLDSYRPYHDALFTYIQSRNRLSKVLESANYDSNNAAIDNSMMQIDGAEMGGGNDEAVQAQEAMDDAELKFLASLASISLSRGEGGGGGGGTPNGDDEDDENIMASTNEGNLWDLMSALRTGGLSSLFYCVSGEEVPDLQLSNDPTSMVDSSPAEVLEACLLGGDDERNASLPLQRLTAALGWIEACHGRKFEEALKREYEGGKDPILPPPRRRTMWPGTVAALQQRKGSGAFHPDAPILTTEDELDDARLLRACYMLFQAGRIEEALKLVSDCGQPWRAASWTGGEPLSSAGSGNPTRGLWKNQCRKIALQMTQLANSEASSMSDQTRSLFPSSAYEAAILSLLSDNVDTAMENPAFQTWEDAIHAILRSELGIIEDDVLKSHNSARAEACEANGGHFPHRGTEFDSLDDGSAPQGNDGDLFKALEKLGSLSNDRIREEGSDPFRQGMESFLVGQSELKEYIEQCGALSLEAEDDYESGFLRFITHLVLYVDTVLPGFCSQLALPAGIDAATDGSIFSLRELLILKYVAYLSSKRELWPHVALYTSLLSNDNILDTFSSFLIHVHSDQERRMTLNQAREFFPKGYDCYILRNVVRGMILSDTDGWAREAGEEAAPAGIAPADARMMKSINWFCYYPEHMPDALVCANMLLRRFLLSCAENKLDITDKDLYAAKVFVGKILPRDLIDVAVAECQKGEENFAGSISVPLMQNLEAEYLSIDGFLKAHTKYTQFLDAISTTSPCHNSNKLIDGTQSKHETEIADKMERNTFRQKKMGLCKIIIESSTRASEALNQVLTSTGGWLVDVNADLEDEETSTDEAKARSEELDAIRSFFVPKAVSMLHDVLDKTAMWLEQIVFDTLTQFGSASNDILLALFGSFDDIYRSNDDLTLDLLVTSRAAPGYWHKRSLSLASIVANEANCLHKTFNNKEMEDFLKLMAKSHIKLSRCSNLDALFDC